MKSLTCTATLLVVLVAVGLIGQDFNYADAARKDQPSRLLVANQSRYMAKRFVKVDDHRSMMHSHLSRKVFDRACAASKDTIDEILACLSNNEGLMKSVKRDTAAACYRESFELDFDPKDFSKHKDLICNNRDKFENMTACIYRKTAEVLDQKEMEKLTEALVDIGLCIINALDG